MATSDYPYVMPKPTVRPSELCILEVVKVLIADKVAHETIEQVIAHLEQLEVPYSPATTFMDERSLHAVFNEANKRVRTGS